MGLLFSIPLAGSLGTIATSCLGGLAFCFTSTAGKTCLESCMYIPSTDAFLSVHVLQVLQLQLIHSDEDWLRSELINLLGDSRVLTAFAR